MDQLCTLCFRNFGVRREAELVAGGPVSSPCPNCKMIGGGFLDRGVCEQLLRRFFVEGSIPPEAGGHAPVYEFNPHHLHGEVLFATELDSDLELLSRFLSVGLFHYGPPLWRFGHTDHYSALKGNMEDGAATQGEARKAIWEEVIARCSIKTLEPGMSIFRVRRGLQLPPAIPAEFDTPPLDLPAKGGTTLQSGRCSTVQRTLRHACMNRVLLFPITSHWRPSRRRDLFGCWIWQTTSMTHRLERRLSKSTSS